MRRGNTEAVYSPDLRELGWLRKGYWGKKITQVQLLQLLQLGKEKKRLLLYLWGICITVQFTVEFRGTGRA